MDTLVSSYGKFFLSSGLSQAEKQVPQKIEGLGRALGLTGLESEPFQVSTIDCRIEYLLRKKGKGRGRSTSDWELASSTPSAGQSGKI